MEVHLCPRRHAHGKGLECYNRHKCRCDKCIARRHAYDQQHRRVAGLETLVPSLPSARRLQAMARQGWTTVDISRLDGMPTPATISSVRRMGKPMMRASTERQYARMYAKHAFTAKHGAWSDRARREAIESGWPSPMEWLDVQRGILD